MNKTNPLIRREYRDLNNKEINQREIAIHKHTKTLNYQKFPLIYNGIALKLKYTSLDIKKQIPHIFPTKVQNSICEEVGDPKFYIVDGEARDGHWF